MPQAVPILPNKLPIETALLNIAATTEAILLIAKAIGRSEGSNALTHLAGLIENEAELLRQLVLGDECEAV